jgi:hypothetical protein
MNGLRCCCADIDECGSTPCANGGSCTDGLGSYSCACASGFSGLFCQTDINECVSSPCHPVQTIACVDLPNGFRCDCAAGKSSASGLDSLACFFVGLSDDDLCSLCGVVRLGRCDV